MHVFILLYVLNLITQDLVHKLCHCESTYLKSVDDVRDEMINHWTLLRSRASEPCSLVIKVRALNAHAPTLTFPGARTRCSRPSIGTVFVCDKGPSIQRTGDFTLRISISTTATSVRMATMVKNPSNMFLPWLVTKKFHSQSSPKSSL